jgi:hypothetical protein
LLLLLLARLLLLLLDCRRICAAGWWWCSSSGGRRGIGLGSCILLLRLLALLLLLPLAGTPREVIDRAFKGGQQALRVPPSPCCCLCHDFVNLLVCVWSRRGHGNEPVPGSRNDMTSAAAAAARRCYCCCWWSAGSAPYPTDWRL